MKYLLNNKMRARYLIVVTLLLFSLTFVSSETINLNDLSDLGIVKQNTCISLYQYCPTCSYVNVTSIKYPNQNVEMVNYAMSKSVNDYNYSFCNTSLIGEYSYTVCGDKSGSVQCEKIKFESTPSGFRNTLGFFILILCLSLGIIVIGYWMQDAIVALFGSFGLYFLGIYILFNGIAGMKDKVTTWAIGLIILGIAFYISARASNELIINGDDN